MNKELINFRKELYDHILNNKIDDLSMKTFRTNFKAHYDTIEKSIIKSKQL